MATQTYGLSDIPNLERQISGLQDQVSSYQDDLNSSPTALGGSGTPTSSDISNQESLQRIQSEIQNLTDAKLRARWYTPKTQDSSTTASGGGEVSPGLVGSTLDFLARPLYGIVGATKHAIGQGTGSLYQDIADNMVRNKNTFRDVLKSSGSPGSIATPLGFALDIALDPVNWATMGTAAVIPRLASGLYKGAKAGEAMRGLSLAAKSSVLEKATTIGRLTPVFRKSEKFMNLGERAMASTDAWEKFSGVTIADLVKQKGMGVGRYRIGLGEVINRVADATPGGRTFVDALWYDPKDWIRQARVKDIVQRQLGVGVDMKEAYQTYKEGGSMAPYLRQAAEKISSAPVDKIRMDFNAAESVMSPAETEAALAKMSQAGIPPVSPEAAAEIVNNVDDAYTALLHPEVVTSGDLLENTVRIANETIGGSPITIQEIEKIMKSGAMDVTGVKWFDNMMGGMRSFEKQIGSQSNNIVIKGKNIMGAYDTSMAIFRVSKVGLSPTAYVNAVVGNMIMTHLANGDLGPGFLKTLQLSFNMYRGKPGAVQEVEKLLFGMVKDKLERNPEMVHFFEEFKTAARGTFGTLDFLSDTRSLTARVYRDGIDAGLISSATKEADILPAMQEVIDKLSATKTAAERKLFAESLAKRRTVKAGTTAARDAMASGGSYLDKGGGMLSNELFNSNMSAEIFKTVEDNAKANPNHLGWKLLNATMNKLPSQYEKVDQIYKLTTFLRATTHGYTINQIRQMRHLVDISAEEMALGRTVSREEGQVLYKLMPKTALELANVMYLNYAAMPAAIRVLRNFPLLGSPFVSFMYGMSLKTGQTLAYNPAAFNKVTFAMNDFSGSKTPLEKKALDNQYYSYLKQPGMFRMPFFEKNPVYLNMANMIPYYSLNMFNPTQTAYGNSPRELLAQAVQSSPLFKHPIGTALFDFMIQPLILGDAIRPQGQFGQPLYPLDATFLDKVGYGTRSLAEAYVPGIASYGGLAVPGKYSALLPSYRARAISQAKEGNNQLGISGKEPAISRTIREILKATGVPVQAPVNTSFNQGQ
jgi:hypothetical protein